MAFIQPNIVLTLGFLFICTFESSICKQDEYFDEVPKELRCSGCELTVKVLDQMLGSLKPKDVPKFIDEALSTVCNEKRFSISEYNANSMVKTCEYMLDSHATELKNELVKHYQKRLRSTYIEMSQQICLNIMRLCPGASFHAPLHHESADHFDHFMKVSGFDAKVANAVPEPAAHDEL